MINPYNNSQVSNRDFEDSEDDDENEEATINNNSSRMEIKEDDEDLNNSIDNRKNNSVQLIQKVNPSPNTHNLQNSKVNQSQHQSNNSNNITPNSMKISSKDDTAKSDILTKMNNKTTPNVKTQIKETTLNLNNNNNNNETNVKEKDNFKKINVNSNLPQQKPNLIQDNSIMNKADNKPHRLNKRSMLSDTNVQQYLNQDKNPNESNNTKVNKPTNKSFEKVLGIKMNENEAYDKKEKGNNFDNYI